MEKFSLSEKGVDAYSAKLREMNDDVDRIITGVKANCLFIYNLIFIIIEYAIKGAADLYYRNHRSAIFCTTSLTSESFNKIDSA